MSQGESDFHYSKNIICCKWFNNKPVLLQTTNVDGISGISNVMRKRKGPASKTSASCPNIIKLYNKGVSGVHIMGQETATYRLNRKSKHRFYLKMFFDLIEVALANSNIVYKKLVNDISLLNFKIVVGKV